MISTLAPFSASSVVSQTFKRHSLCLLILTALALAMLPAADTWAQYGVVRVATGLSQPIYATAAPNDPNRLFIVQQQAGGSAAIKILDLTSNTINPTPFATVTGLFSGFNYSGVTMVFSPNYATDGRFYVNASAASGDITIRQYTVSANPNVANAAYTPVMTIPQEDENAFHYGGFMGFSPTDGHLYITTGDGSYNDDPNNDAQTITNDLRGKVLRIDVNSDAFPGDPNKNYAIPASNPFVNKTGDDEIWAYGLRNPWRASFDRATGDLYIADVGGSLREEVNVQSHTSLGGENYGWRIREGTIDNPNTPGVTPPGAVDPVFEYDHSQGSDIIGGYVYQGLNMPSLHGIYFFADQTSNRIWSIRVDPATHAVSEVTDRTAELAYLGVPLTNIVSFGEDSRGEMYIVSYNGDVFRLAFTGDLNHDSLFDMADYTVFRSNFLRSVAAGTNGDFTGNGFVDLDDFTRFRTSYENVYGPGSSASLPPIPEPSTWVLAALAALMIGWYRRRMSV